TPGFSSLSPQLWRDMQQGGEVAARAQGRITLSWMSGQFLWSLAKSGMISGHGPIDPEMNKNWQAKGFQPYSISFNGKDWYSYRNLDPAATVIGLMADLAQFHSDTNFVDPEHFGRPSMRCQCCW